MKNGFTKSWNMYLEYFPQKYKDIYFTEEYVKLYEGDQKEAECFIYRDRQNVFLFPYIKRKIKLLGDDYFDFETSYGYAGPLVNSENFQFASEAFRNFIFQAKENRMIAGFIRFHPLLDNYKLLTDECRVVFNRYTIAMNLELKEDTIWSEQIHSKHRNSIKLAQRQGLSYSADEELRHLDIFRELYISKMNKLRAEEFYFFDDNFFNRIKKNLGKNTFLGLVSFNEKVVAAALFFKYGNYGHYHLSASSEDYTKFGSNNFLIYNTALYLKQHKAGLLHLGGGNSSSLDDNLYRFKARFSKDRYSFYTGGVVLDQHLYKEICSIWSEKFPEKREKYNKFVLKYAY